MAWGWYMGNDGNFVRFTMGDTLWLTDPVSGERYRAPAQYSKGVITFDPNDEISSWQLNEECIHRVQNSIYGKSMVDGNLNFEFEAKLIQVLIAEGGGIDCMLKFTEEQDIVDFGEFIDNISKGTCDDKTLLEGYQKFFKLWNDEGYVGRPGCEKTPDFDPILLREISESFKSKK